MGFFTKDPLTAQPIGRHWKTALSNGLVLATVPEVAVLLIGTALQMASFLLVRDTTCIASHRLAFTELLKGFICTVASNLKRQWCPTNLNEDGDGAESGRTDRHSHARILGTIAEIV